jgi:hypothetical protein
MLITVDPARLPIMPIIDFRALGSSALCASSMSTHLGLWRSRRAKA